MHFQPHFIENEARERLNARRGERRRHALARGAEATPEDFGGRRSTNHQTSADVFAPRPYIGASRSESLCNRARHLTNAT